MVRARTPGNAFMMFLATAALWAFPQTIAGQQPGSCTYDACALSLFTSWTGEVRVVSGRDALDLTGVDRSAALEDIFRTNDTAFNYYGRFARRDRFADQMDYLAGGLLLTGVALDLFDGDGHSFWAISLDAAGIGLYLIGSPILRTQGMNELSRAVWWYNRALPR